MREEGIRGKKMKMIRRKMSEGPEGKVKRKKR